MDDFARVVLTGIRLAVFIGSSGAIFAISIIAVCRWLKWAPINITVNVNDYRPGAAPDDAVGSPQERPFLHEEWDAGFDAAGRKKP